MNNRQYKQAKVQSTKGFGKQSDEQRDNNRQQTIFYFLGYGAWIDWATVDHEELPLTQKHPVEATVLFSQLAEGNVLEARATLDLGPWEWDELGRTLPDLDRVALKTSPERQELGLAMTQETLRKLKYQGFEQYHYALQRRHKESVEATEALQATLESIGLELWDTGACYTREGAMDGPRDLVMGDPNSEVEYAFRIYHAPRKAEYEGDLPVEIAEVVSKWERA